MRRMKYFLLLISLCLSLAVTAQNNNDIQKGIEYYDKGDYSSALAYLQRAAKAGSLPALERLGYMYAFGNGVGRDGAIALNLLNKGLEKNYAPCIYALGIIYANGAGVSGNPIKAYEYYKRAADLDYGPGQLAISKCKMAGFGTEEDAEGAFQYAEKAANNGLGFEQLGDMYFDGYGTEKSDAKAYEWYNKASSDYSDRAILRRAIILSRGTSDVQSDPIQALSLLKTLKDKNSGVEYLDDWYRKIDADAKEQIRRDNIITYPSFTPEINQYIKNYPSPAKPAIESAGRGEIVISCRILSSGHVSSAGIKYRVLERLDNAALDLVRNMPPLKPGTKGGKNAELNIEIGVQFFPTRVRIVQ